MQGVLKCKRKFRRERVMVATAPCMKSVSHYSSYSAFKMNSAQLQQRQILSCAKKSCALKVQIKKARRVELGLVFPLTKLEGSSLSFNAKECRSMNVGVV
jgi:hypothetical protein